MAPGVLCAAGGLAALLPSSAAPASARATGPSATGRGFLLPAPAATRLGRAAAAPQQARGLHVRAMASGDGERQAGSSNSSVLPPAPAHVTKRLEGFDLPTLAAGSDGEAALDLVVVGGGPSGLAVAQRVASAGMKVCVVDPDPLVYWPNNYGVWVDEFEALGLTDCLEIVWPRAKVQLGEGPANTKYLDRAYGRVDRVKLKQRMLRQCIAAGVVFRTAKAEGVSHAEGASTLALSDGGRLRAAAVVDASGHSRSLVQFGAQTFDPGYQGAYGIMVDVDEHPFELDTMFFMDWRDEHLAGDAAMRARNAALPTFLYVMPMGPKRVFLQETSLVARPAVPFDELKKRMEARVRHYGIKVKSIEAEEFCLIPMGSVLPVVPQPVLAIGGAAGMVHPSTGFAVARMLSAAPVLADSIVESIAASRAGGRFAKSNPPPAAVAADAARAAAPGASQAALAAQAWGALWPEARLRQRAFFNFGMHILLQLDLAQTREFFTAFFDLQYREWSGFLSSRLTFGELFAFGLSLFAKSSNDARLSLMAKGLTGFPELVTTLAAVKDPRKQATG